MTNSEIIEGLKAIRTIHNGNYAPYVDEAIKRISAEPCEDAISRQKALECFTWTNDKADAWNKIKLLPPVQPKARLIPVTEDLPKTSDDVLVWFEYSKDDYDCAWWGLGYYSLRYKKWVVSTNEHNPIVKAWMALPESYDIESEE